MKKFFKTSFEILLASAVLFLFLEGLFRLAGGAPGTNRFAEKIILREHLAPRKPAGEFRIFGFGESTLHGAHYAPVSSPLRWLEKYLEDFLPGRKIRVISFARLGRGADFAYRTFEQTLPYQPDLVIVYLGHNVFLPRNRKAEVEAARKSFRAHVRRIMKPSIFISTAYRWIIWERMKWRRDKPEDEMEFPKIETAPRSFMENGVTLRESQTYIENIEFFKTNIRQMLRLARKRKIPIVFLKPVSNLKDFAPFYSLHQNPLLPAALLEWQKAYEAGQDRESQGDLVRAETFYLHAYEIDGTYADLNFRLGRLYFQKGEYEKAKKFFEEARDYDALISRAPREILQDLEDLKRGERLDLLDTESMLLSEVPSGILGEPVVEDNVHFSIKGHALVGRQLARELAARNLVAPQGDWQFQRERPFPVLLKELGVNDDFLFSADLKMVHYFGRHFQNRLRFARRALAIHRSDPRALRHLAWTYWLMGEKARALGIYGMLEREHPGILFEIFDNLKLLSSGNADDYESRALIDDLTHLEKAGPMGRFK